MCLHAFSLFYALLTHRGILFGECLAHPPVCSRITVDPESFTGLLDRRLSRRDVTLANGHGSIACNLSGYRACSWSPPPPPVSPSSLSSSSIMTIALRINSILLNSSRFVRRVQVGLAPLIHSFDFYLKFAALLHVVANRVWASHTQTQTQIYRHSLSLAIHRMQHYLA